MRKLILWVHTYIQSSILDLKFSIEHIRWRCNKFVLYNLYVRKNHKLSAVSKYLLNLWNSPIKHLQTFLKLGKAVKHSQKHIFFDVLNFLKFYFDVCNGYFANLYILSSNLKLKNKIFKELLGSILGLIKWNIEYKLSVWVPVVQ